MNSSNSLLDSTQRYKAYNDTLDPPKAADQTPQAAIAEAQQLASRAEARMRAVNARNAEILARR
jgi:hypothetical protein